MELAHRNDRASLVIYVDLDGLKRINDTLGHDAGSQALLDTAQVLRATFRESDIVSRFGGDEFVILMLDADCDNVTCIASRLQANVARHNQAAHRPYELSLSVGVILFDPNAGMMLEAAIARADEAMYLQKHNRQWARGA
jgi:diguanylate cyclase (GGDEF)-like protein